MTAVKSLRVLNIVAYTSALLQSNQRLVSAERARAASSVLCRMTLLLIWGRDARVRLWQVELLDFWKGRM